MISEKQLKYTKIGARAVVGICVSHTVKQVLENTVDPDTVPQRVMIWGGAFVIGWMAKDAAKKFVDAKIDKGAEWYVENVEPKIKEAKEAK